MHGSRCYKWKIVSCSSESRAHLPLKAQAVGSVFSDLCGSPVVGMVPLMPATPHWCFTSPHLGPNVCLQMQCLMWNLPLLASHSNISELMKHLHRMQRGKASWVLCFQKPWWQQSKLTYWNGHCSPTLGISQEGQGQEYFYRCPTIPFVIWNHS